MSEAQAVSEQTTAATGLFLGSADSQPTARSVPGRALLPPGPRPSWRPRWARAPLGSASRPRPRPLSVTQHRPRPGTARSTGPAPARRAAQAPPPALRRPARGLSTRRHQAALVGHVEPDGPPVFRPRRLGSGVRRPAAGTGPASPASAALRLITLPSKPHFRSHFCQEKNRHKSAFRSPLRRHAGGGERGRAPTVEKRSCRGPCGASDPECPGPQRSTPVPRWPFAPRGTTAPGLGVLGPCPAAV